MNCRPLSSFGACLLETFQWAFKFKLPYLLFRAEGNKAYLLKLESDVQPIYCHMTDDLGACGSGVWTLVMKIDGNKVFRNILIPKIKWNSLLVGL